VDTAIPTAVNDGLLNESAEKALASRVKEVTPVIEKHLNDKDYGSAMNLTATLRDDVDAFFDNVMVMDPDTALRDNRLALLAQVNSLCCGTAELALLKPSELSASKPGNSSA